LIADRRNEGRPHTLPKRATDAVGGEVRKNAKVVLLGSALAIMLLGLAFGS